jgi:hypothetical protein
LSRGRFSDGEIKFSDGENGEKISCKFFVNTVELPGFWGGKRGRDKMGNNQYKGFILGEGVADGKMIVSPLFC